MSIQQERRVPAVSFLREAAAYVVPHSSPGEAAAQLSVWGERLLATIPDHKSLHFGLPSTGIC